MRIYVLISLLAFFATVAVRAETPEPLWTESVQALTRGDPASAEAGFQKWILESESKGTFSPEAHYNLGLSLWNQQKRGGALYHWLKSATLQPTIFSRWKSLDLLADVERDIGMKEGVSEMLEFRLWVLFADDWILGIATVAFWTLAGCFLIAWVHGGRSHKTAKILAIVPATLLLVATVGAVFRKTTFDFGVLDGPQGVTVYRVADDKAEYKLVQLPAGTLAAATRREKNFVHLSQPVAGWVPVTTFQSVTRQ